MTDYSNIETTSGNRGLSFEEPLIFELDSQGSTAVDLEEPSHDMDRLGGLRRRGSIGLPGLSAITPVCRKRTIPSTQVFIPSARAP